MGGEAPKNVALCVFDEQQSGPVPGQASHHPGEAFPVQAGGKHQPPGSSQAVGKLRENGGSETSPTTLLLVSYADLWRQKHDGGNVQQAPEPIPGSLSTGGQQVGGRPAAQRDVQALGHQYFQVQRNLGNPKDPVLQTGNIRLASL